MLRHIHLWLKQRRLSPFAKAELNIDLLCGSFCLRWDFVNKDKHPISELKSEQGKDETLIPLFDNVLSGDAIKDVSYGYFVTKGILMRKWTPPELSCADDWSSVYQVVVPRVYRSAVLSFAHDHCMAGHMGV